jgi:deoxycytidylate deaminase
VKTNHTATFGFGDDCSILAQLAIAEISSRRTKLLSAGTGVRPLAETGYSAHKKSAIRIAYIVDQLKRKEEIEILNEIYQKAFFLVGLSNPADDRLKHLKKQIGKPDTYAQELIDLDTSESDYFKGMNECEGCRRKSGESPLIGNKDYGQQLSKVFSEADVFFDFKDGKTSVQRFLDLIFASPFEFPNSAEHAMYMAFASSARSADLSRQVGAVILSSNGDLISSGSNDVPRAGGGIYDRRHHANDGAYSIEANSKRLSEISDNISRYLVSSNLIQPNEKDVYAAKILKETEIGNLTEFHRTVHAEMQAILSATRSGTSTSGSTIYVTTFPCHNCAKHIISAGIKTVVYVEPYAKSQAEHLHGDAIWLSEDGSNLSNKVTIKPFLGIGPRRFIDLFSMKLSNGTSMVRKSGYNAREYKRTSALMRFGSPVPFPFFEDMIVLERKYVILAEIDKIQEQIRKMKIAGSSAPPDLLAKIARLERFAA